RRRRRRGEHHRVSRAKVDREPPGSLRQNATGLKGPRSRGAIRAIAVHRGRDYERSEHPDSPQGVRSPDSRYVDEGNRLDGQADGRAGAWSDSAADADREVYGEPVASRRQEVA